MSNCRSLGPWVINQQLVVVVSLFYLTFFHSVPFNYDYQASKCMLINVNAGSVQILWTNNDWNLFRSLVACSFCQVCAGSLTCILKSIQKKQVVDVYHLGCIKILRMVMCLSLNLLVDVSLLLLPLPTVIKMRGRDLDSCPWCNHYMDACHAGYWL